MTMIYRQNKFLHQTVWWRGKKSLVLTIILLFFLILLKKNGNAILASSLKIWLPEREKIIESRETQILLNQIIDLKKENLRLTEALGIQNGSRKIPARILLKSNYIFADFIFLDRGKNADIEAGDAVISDSGAILGIVSAVGDEWSKVDALGKQGQGLVGRSGRNQQASFEMIGVGGGEMRGRFTADFGNLAVGDIVVWGEEPRYIVGFINELDREKGFLTIENVFGPLHNLVNVFIAKRADEQ